MYLYTLLLSQSPKACFRQIRKKRGRDKTTITGTQYVVLCSTCKLCVTPAVCVGGKKKKNTRKGWKKTDQKQKTASEKRAVLPSWQPIALGLIRVLDCVIPGIQYSYTHFKSTTLSGPVARCVLDEAEKGSRRHCLAFCCVAHVGSSCGTDGIFYTKVCVKVPCNSYQVHY